MNVRQVTVSNATTVDGKSRSALAITDVECLAALPQSISMAMQKNVPVGRLTLFLFMSVNRNGNTLYRNQRREDDDT